MEDTYCFNKQSDEDDYKVDPIFDIIDYLVRCAKISFKNSSINQPELRTNDKIQFAYKLFKQSPVQFLLQFGKYLSPNHLHYFEKLQINNDKFQSCVAELKLYHSDKCANKRIRNRRYKALQKLQQETEYFSEKQMMLRNPLLYEQLIGQYLTDDEIIERDAVGSENLTFLNLILDTVDKNEMREIRNKQMQIEEEEVSNETCYKDNVGQESKVSVKEKQWGDFDIPEIDSASLPESQKHAMINANERNLLREEFLQEMYSSFIEGRDIDFDYNSVDNNEEYDDLQQISQDAEDKYFDSVENDEETLEEHMNYREDYSTKKSPGLNSTLNDPLDIFMEHISKNLQQNV